MFKSPSRLWALLFVIAIIPSSHADLSAAPLGLDVGAPQHKILGGPDEDADLEISVKVMVKNTSGQVQHVDLVVHALDREGFEVFEIFLSGVLKGGQTRAITGSDYIQERRYKTIVGWQIKEVTITGGQPDGDAQPPAEHPSGARNRTESIAPGAERSGALTGGGR